MDNAHEKSTGIFAHTSFLLGIGSSAFWMVFPLFLDNLFHDPSLVGFYYAGVACIALLASVGSTYLLQRYARIQIIVCALIVSIGALGLMYGARNIWQFVGVDILRAIATIIAMITLSLFLFETVGKQRVTEAEGTYYLFANIGWLLGPIIGGYIATFFEERSVFLFAGLFYGLALLHFSIQSRLLPASVRRTPAYDTKMTMSPCHSLSIFVHHWFLMRAFLIALGLFMWYAVSIIYIPLSLKELGYSTEVIGWVVGANVLPFILLEKWIGKKARQCGIRPFLIAGYALLFLFILSFILLPRYFPPALLVAFVLVSIGAACIEPLHEAYFFRLIPRREASCLFGAYNAAFSLAAVIGPLLASLAFSFAGGVYGVWLMLACVFFLLILVTLGISEKHIASFHAFHAEGNAGG